MEALQADCADEAWLVEGLAAALALKWVETERQARVLCTDALELVWANAAAQDSLKDGSEIEIRGASLVLRNRAAQTSFSAFLADCDTVQKSFCLVCDDGDGHLLVRARQLGSDGSRRFLGVTFVTTGSRFSAEYSDIDKVFQLTPAETRILAALIEGQTVDRIAGSGNVSVETVRSHIRSIYGKMNVTSREGLFFKIRAFRL